MRPDELQVYLLMIALGGPGFVLGVGVGMWLNQYIERLGLCLKRKLCA